MAKYEEWSKAVLERKVHWSIHEKMGEEMRGKTDEEKMEISRKYAKMIMETCPPRKKDFWQTCAERKLSASDIRMCAVRLKDKTGEEREKTLAELAEIIVKTCPLRQKEDTR